MYKINEKIESMYCIKYNEEYPVGDYFLGCPKCLKRGENAALSFRYEAVPSMPIKMVTEKIKNCKILIITTSSGFKNKTEIFQR